MHMKQAGWMSLFVGLALATASCGGGGSGGSDGGRMYSLTCTLGCTNGEGGQQVSCGIVNTFQNQDIAVLFSERVDLAWIKANANAFQVINTATAISPPGGPLLDPTNPRRLIWRPELKFNSLGTPQYGFDDGASYQIRVPGTAQGDTGPYVQSTGGKKNESRILCTITTDQGVVDPVPGAPTVDIFVTEIDGISGLPKPGTLLADVTNTVATNSPITFVFKDIMTLGTVVNPSTKQAPFITVKVDPDGNLSDPTDQINIDGTYQFNIDPVRLETTAVFVPDTGFPGAGAGFPANPRRFVINIPAQVIDLVNNPVSNGGFRNFVPQVVSLGTIEVPLGGEQFTTSANEDPRRSGADWGASQPGRLKPGTGGGSGRLGDLVIEAGETVTLYTSQQFARGSFEFQNNPANGDEIWFDDGVNPQEAVKIRNNVNAIPGNFHVQREDFTSDSLARMAYEMPLMRDFGGAGMNPTPIIDQVDFHVEDEKFLIVTPKVIGTAGENITLSVDPANGAVIVPISPTGGVDTNSFGGVGEIGESQTVTNYDFQANPGGTPPSVATINGQFEFAHVDIQAGGTLRFVGDNPAQLLVRGLMNVADGGVIDVSGASAPTHVSSAPRGQIGGIAGAGGGFGGKGADRPDNGPDVGGSDLLNLPTNAGSMTYDAGIVNPMGFPDGLPGLGVGRAFGNSSGLGGLRWPSTLPTSQAGLQGLETNTGCDSEQVGTPGSGGAYATDGGLGVAVAPNPLSAQGNSNTGPDTAGGSNTGLLEAPGTTAQVPPTPRTLYPRAGFLRGGAGGGSGSSHVYLTSTDGVDPNCIIAPSVIDTFRSHSGAAGGGAGGGIQIQVGGLATMNGVIDASGGDGGSFDATAWINGTSASPGGGGSGGAILLQAGILDVSLVAARLLVPGGAGGVGEWGSTGGDGGTGLVRAESLTALSATELAGSIDPIDPMDPTSLDWLSIGTWLPDDRPPESFSGSQSCWMKPAGSFFELNPQDDVDPVNGPFGWNMDMILDTGGGPATHAYRGSTVYGGNSPQTFWGELLAADLGGGQSGAAMVVRFQGAKSTGALSAPCDIEPGNAGGQIVNGSVTPWVRHPAELTAFTPEPDMIRFLIIFDASHPDFADIQGVTNLSILTDPD